MHAASYSLGRIRANAKCNRALLMGLFAGGTTHGRTNPNGLIVQNAHDFLLVRIGDKK